MRVYHFVCEKYGVEDLQRKRLKIATLDDLNDPFELLGPACSSSAERNVFLEMKKGLSSSSGLLCFSSNWKNPVQWSHYADRHRGLCFGFDVPDKYLMKVKYRQKRFEPNMRVLSRRDHLAQAHMQEILSTKYSHWRYENEQRVWTNLDGRDAETGLFFKSFSDEMQLKEVIVGHQSTLSRSDLAKALGSDSASVKQCKARLAFKSFTVVTQKDQRLWA